MKLEFFDSTLRDGSQSQGISFSVADKINIVKVLDEFGIDYIEAGNPGSNPKDLMFFEQMASVKLKHAKLCSFGSTCRNNVAVEQDNNIINLLKSGTPVVAIFGKSWDLHVTEILKISLEDNLKIVSDTIAYLKSKGKEVIFDAEHFFDGYKNNSEYAMRVLQAAYSSGADCLCLCDTNGGTMPFDIEKITKTVCDSFSGVRVSIHCHNDTGCAVANSLAAVYAGAVQIQGTFIGYGERCGNADLSTILPNLILKCGYSSHINLENLYNVSRVVAEISNIQIPYNRPYIGKSAFAHKGGMHVDGVIKLPRSFEHIDPSQVGNRRKFLMSEVSGKSTVLPKLQEFVPSLQKNSPETEIIINELKNQELLGYHYEAADASFDLFVKKQLKIWKPHFNIIFFKTSDDYPAPSGSLRSSAVIEIEVDGQRNVSGAVGNGPVNALDNALRKALMVFYPEVKTTELTDFKVRVIDQSSTTAARVRVLIDSSDGESGWTTIGVSNDVIEASFIALVDSFEYKLSRKES